MIQLIGLVAGAVLTAGSLVVPAAAVDQETADAAIDAFTQRMVGAGFVVEPDDDADPEDDGDAAADDVIVEEPDSVEVDDADAENGDTDDAFDECLAAAGIDVPADPDAPMPGTTAEAESPELEFAPGAGPTGTTEALDLSPTVPESIAATVITVDDAGVGLMTQLVDWMGSKSAAQCFEQTFLDDVVGADDDDADEGDDGDDMDLDMPPPEIEVSNGPDIGVGDRSARIDMSLSLTFIVEIEMDMTILFAQSGRSMAMVMHVTGADGAMSGVDPVAELQSILDDLAPASSQATLAMTSSP